MRIVEYQPKFVEDIFLLARRATVEAPGYRAEAWDVLEDDLAKSVVKQTSPTSRLREVQELPDDYDVLLKVGDLLRSQGGRTGPIDLALAHALRNANALHRKLEKAEGFEQTYLSLHSCYAWTEVERLRRVLRTS